VPIRPYLAGQAFEPEIIKNMSAALAGACDALQLKMHDDPATRFVAEKVIGLAQRGIRDVGTLRRMTLKEFGIEEVKAPEYNPTLLTDQYADCRDLNLATRPHLLRD
jgi:hypothetical protein